MRCTGPGESTEDGLSIRSFAPPDWDALCAVYDRAARVELDLCGVERNAFRPLPEVEDLEEFQELNTAVVACADGRPVGFVAWRDRGVWRDSGYLSWLYIDPAYHRRRIGDRLMAEAMDALSGQAWTLVKLGNEPAIHLYRKHGMRIVKFRPAGTREHPHTELRMALPTSRKFDRDAPSFGGPESAERVN